VNRTRSQAGAEIGTAHRVVLKTPLGPVVAEWGGLGLRSLRFTSRRAAANLPRLSARGPGRGSGGEPGRLARELERYFRTGRSRFGVRLDVLAGTEFDRAVWEELRRIPAGELRTYGELARSIGRPRAARAVGGACRRNPVAILVPCHRVVAANGLGGYAAGAARKRALLELEGARFPLGRKAGASTIGGRER